MILLKNYLTNSSVCCVIFYYSRAFITIKNLELSYKAKKQPLQGLLENIIYLLDTLVYSMANIFELFQHPIRLPEACA